MNKALTIAIALTGLAAAPAPAQMGSTSGGGMSSLPGQNGGMMQSGGMQNGPGPRDMDRGMDHGSMDHGTMDRGSSKSDMDHRRPMDDRHAGIGRDGRHDTDPPSHWRGKKMAWNTHMMRCQKRYSSYNPHTDMYMLRHGKKARCRL